MRFGVQYYRPPFPESRYWREDLQRMKASGFDTVQFWVNWGWVEPEQGRFVFDDYDQLMDLALENGLQVVLSLSAELQPYWIHRAVPGSEMVDHMGSLVVSSNRGEAHQGLTPGGCTDHPQVLALMKRFLQTVAARYAGHPALYAWDCWNELRWCIQSDGLVCYCPHTKQAFRQWLDRRYSGLEGLNHAWKRRYGCWEDVEPGKLPGRPYTEMMEFEAFAQWKLAQHLKFRVHALRAMDSRHIIAAHEGGPPSLYGWGRLGQYGNGEHMLHALHSGSFFDMADQADVFGTSHYPGFQTATLAEFGAGVELTRSANPGRSFWISELQGYDGDAANLSMWFWSGLARGAKTVLAWAWRSEVFGREAGSLGIWDRNDGTGKRLKVFGEIGSFLARHGALLDDYQPDRPETALFHDANAYNLEWAATGDTAESVFSLKGWSKALERARIPYSFVDTGHLEGLRGIRLLVMGRPAVVSASAAQNILQFVEDGGTLLIEGGADAFTTLGFYQYPGEDRPFASALGIDYGPEIQLAEYGPYYQLPDPGVKREETEFRRLVPLRLQGKEYAVYAEGALAPLMEREGTEVLARDEDGYNLATARKIGQGTVVALGMSLGKGYHRSNDPGLEALLRGLSILAGVPKKITINGGDVYWHTGMAKGRRLLFLINAGPKAQVTAAVPKTLLPKTPSPLELIRNDPFTFDDTPYAWQISLEIEKGGARLLALD